MSALPYSLPDDWQLHETQLTRRWPVVVWSLIAVALAVAMAVANLENDVGSAILYASLFGGIVAALGVSYQRAGTERGLPHLINAIVLTRATVRPPDRGCTSFAMRDQVGGRPSASRPRDCSRQPR
jgi:hypothetical protein